MIKRIEQKFESKAGHAGVTLIMHATPPNPRYPHAARAFLSLPLPLPDYRPTPRWPAREKRRPEAVLYLVDYTVSAPGQSPEDSQGR